MTRKDYVAIAQAIKDGQFIDCPTKAELAMNKATRTKIAYQIGFVLQAENPRFDRVRFLKACGVQS